MWHLYCAVMPNTQTAHHPGDIFTYACSTVPIFLSVSHLRRAMAVTHVNEICGYLTVNESFHFSLKLISSQIEPQRQFTYSWWKWTMLTKSDEGHLPGKLQLISADLCQLLSIESKEGKGRTVSGITGHSSVKKHINSNESEILSETWS